MARLRSQLYFIAALAAIAVGLAACQGWGSSQQEIDYQQCRWGVGCQARCAQGYEGYIPYCGRD